MLSYIKDIVTIIQSLFTMLALSIGGFWSYLIFVRKRQRYPRAKIEHQVAQRFASEDATLLCIDVIISNVGDVLLSLVKEEFEVRQVLPPKADFLQLLNSSQIVPSRRVELVDWPLLFSSEEDWEQEKRVVEVEPGESGRFPFMLLVRAEVKTIYINSFFRNTKKRRRELGWRVETFHDVLPDNSGDRVVAQIAGS
jgi:hypothetical protein